mmetsp:Transcript_10349/g.20550  ORF Transcript_10349/g.20550 Transcript_10349/m.20550 type:complete len:143 (-) Transcript_10349:409-837(-)
MGICQSEREPESVPTSFASPERLFTPRAAPDAKGHKRWKSCNDIEIVVLSKKTEKKLRPALVLSAPVTPATARAAKKANRRVSFTQDEMKRRPSALRSMFGGPPPFSPENSFIVNRRPMITPILEQNPTTTERERASSREKA